MQGLFPGYYRKTEEDIKKIWEHGILMFDANVLLNLYRYSNSTLNTMLDLISKFSKQIYLPFQAALEYNRNRYEVIYEQEKAYLDFLGKINQIQKDLQSTNKPPFLTSIVDNELNSIFKKVEYEVNESTQKYCEYLRYDPIYYKISELFMGRITEKFSDEELKEIYTEGESRFKNKVPPGFEDEKTKDGYRKYGDLVLWKQIIKKAKELNKDVILITDERKIDWWWKIKDGRVMGPRYELVEEIKHNANVDFHMYSSEKFLSYGQSFLEEAIDQHALDELRAMKITELEDVKRIQIFEKNEFEQDLRTNDDLNILGTRINDINQKLLNIRNYRNSIETLFKEVIESDNAKDYLHNLQIQEDELIRMKIELKNRLKYFRNVLNETETDESKLIYVMKFEDFMNRKD